jgi:hypothetical protein
MTENSRKYIERTSQVETNAAAKFREIQEHEAALSRELAKALSECRSVEVQTNAKHDQLAQLSKKNHADLAEQLDKATVHAEAARQAITMRADTLHAGLTNTAEQLESHARASAIGLKDLEERTSTECKLLNEQLTGHVNELSEEVHKWAAVTQEQDEVVKDYHDTWDRTLADQQATCDRGIERGVWEPDHAAACGSRPQDGAACEFGH